MSALSLDLLIRPGHKFQRRWADQDLTEWEIDEEGNLCHVIWRQGHPNFDKLRYGTFSEEIYIWMLENTTGDFFYDIEEDLSCRRGKNKTYEYRSRVVIYFEKYEDSLMFRLMWG